MRYSPTILILSRSPPILSFISANQSATQKINVPPAAVHLFTFIALKTPCAMCMRPDGSKPSYSTKPGFFCSSDRSSDSETHSSPTLSTRDSRAASAGSSAGAAPGAPAAPSAVAFGAAAGGAGADGDASACRAAGLVCCVRFGGF
eukprot:scaffold25917_cov121-Isochrysis_galbana.AAC.1